MTDRLVNGAIPFNYYSSALLQYGLISQIKQQGETNASVDSRPAQKHKHRMKEFCQGLFGCILDVGCDSPAISTQLLPVSCNYVGLDPYAKRGEFRIIGYGEILPFSDHSFDAVIFNTSLDHILDYHEAIEEAARVLRSDGTIVIATYAWTSKATLLTDNVHFHHFREYELLGALQERFEIIDVKRYEDPKHATHRYGLYLSAKKGIKTQ